MLQKESCPCCYSLAALRSDKKNGINLTIHCVGTTSELNEVVKKQLSSSRQRADGYLYTISKLIKEVN